jgi:predicted enzyme related to lactoylglutathione lyase
MSDYTVPKPKLELVVLDCPDALELARFYADVLGWAIEDGSDSGWATLVPPGGAHPQQFHLDLWAGDIDGAEPAVLAAGATVHEHQPSETGSFRVYLDPAGHPFCLVGKP